MSLRQQLEVALKGHNADYVEIRIEETETTHLTYRGRELDEVGRSANRGGCVRAAFRGGWGFVSFNALDDLPAKVAAAWSQSPKIQTTNAGYSDGRRKVTFANSEGSYIEQERARATARIQVLARDGSNVQQA